MGTALPAASACSLRGGGNDSRLEAQDPDVKDRPCLRMPGRSLPACVGLDEATGTGTPSEEARRRTERTLIGTVPVRFLPDADRRSRPTAVVDVRVSTRRSRHRGSPGAAVPGPGSWAGFSMPLRQAASDLDRHGARWSDASRTTRRVAGEGPSGAACCRRAGKPAKGRGHRAPNSGGRAQDGGEDGCVRCRQGRTVHPTPGRRTGSVTPWTHGRQ